MEEITLEKIDILRERAGVTYREARDVLERTGGDVIQALVELEGKSQGGWTEEFSVKSNEVIEKVKDLIREGNVTKIRIKHDDKVLVEIPVTLGAIGAVVLPQIAALGVLVAVFKRCTIEVVREGDGAGQVDNPQAPFENKEPPRNIL
jgi:translation initiation factor IF-1